MPHPPWFVVVLALVMWGMAVLLFLRIRHLRRPGQRRVGVSRSRLPHPNFWRTGNEPPTPRQEAFLRAHRVPIPPTKAEASLRISELTGD